jgi:hypothetical protein
VIPVTLDRLHDRRGFLRIGGLGLTTAALVAACGSDGGEAGRVGVAPGADKLPDPLISDIALLRTATSLEYSAIAVYGQVFALKLLPEALVAAATRFRDEHQAHADLFAGLTEKAGGTPWLCGNPRIDTVVIAPMIDRILNGAPATSADPAIAPSDDPLRDVLTLAHGLETLAGATYQSLVPLLNDPALRRQAMVVAADEVRHASLLALTINPDRPGGYVSPADAANAQPSAPETTAPPTTVQDIASPTTVAGGEEAVPATEIPSVTAVPSQFGQLGAVLIVVGAPDVNGARLKTNIETLSLNSLVYEYQGACPST